MDYQLDSRNHRTQEVRVGVENRQVAIFNKASFFIQNLRGDVDGVEYQLKLAAPWNALRFQLRQGESELASARRSRRMHAFEADRPLIRHHMVEFQLDIPHTPTVMMSPEDRHGLVYVLTNADGEFGRLSMRSFAAQEAGEWQADLTLPAGSSVPLAAFVGWIAREGRGDMSR